MSLMNKIHALKVEPGVHGKHTVVRRKDLSVLAHFQS